MKKNESISRQMLAIELLVPNPHNPNEMSEKQFNLLYDNMEKMGFTDPILCRPHPEKEGFYRIIGGYHRWEVAKQLGYTEVPCTIITDPEFSEDEEKFQIVRHNIIGGKMDVAKFTKLVESLSGKYSNEVAAELFGFTSEEDFKKLVKSTVKSLPKEMQQEFKSAAKELKTIDELAKLLNHMFATYGDTLDHGYMIFEYGGYESIWLRQQTGQLKTFRAIASRVRDGKRSVDQVMTAVLQHLNSAEGEALLGKLIGDCPVVQVKEDAPYATLDFLD